MNKNLFLIATVLSLGILEGSAFAAEPPTAEGRQKMALTHHEACKGGEPKACEAFKKVWNGTLYETGLNIYWVGATFTIEMGELETSRPPWKASASLVSFKGKPTYSPTGGSFWAFKSVSVDYPKVVMSGSFGSLGEITFEGEVVDPKGEEDGVIIGTLTQVKSGKTTTTEARLKTWQGD